MLVTQRPLYTHDITILKISHTSQVALLLPLQAWTITKSPTTGGIETIGKNGNTGVYYTITNNNNPSCIAFGFDVGRAMGQSSYGTSTQWYTRLGDILPFYSSANGYMQWRGHTNVYHYRSNATWYNDDVRSIIEAWFYTGTSGTTAAATYWEKGMIYVVVPPGGSVRVRLLGRMYTNDLSLPQWQGTSYTNSSWQAFGTIFNGLFTHPSNTTYYRYYTSVENRFFEYEDASVAATALNTSPTTVCAGGFNQNFNMAGGSLGTGAQWYLYNGGSCAGASIANNTTGTFSVAIPSFTTQNGSTHL